MVNPDSRGKNGKIGGTTPECTAPGKGRGGYDRVEQKRKKRCGLETTKFLVCPEKELQTQQREGGGKKRKRIESKREPVQKGVILVRRRISKERQRSAYSSRQVGTRESVMTTRKMRGERGASGGREIGGKGHHSSILESKK